MFVLSYCFFRFLFDRFDGSKAPLSLPLASDHPYVISSSFLFPLRSTRRFLPCRLSDVRPPRSFPSGTRRCVSRVSFASMRRLLCTCTTHVSSSTIRSVRLRRTDPLDETGRVSFPGHEGGGVDPPRRYKTHDRRNGGVKTPRKKGRGRKNAEEATSLGRPLHHTSMGGTLEGNVGFHNPILPRVPSRWILDAPCTSRGALSLQFRMRMPSKVQVSSRIPPTGPFPLVPCPFVEGIDRTWTDLDGTKHGFDRTCDVRPWPC